MQKAMLGGLSWSRDRVSRYQKQPFKSHTLRDPYFSARSQIKVVKMGLLASICLSVCPHVTAGDTLNGFL
jgi:hypothetical protein